MAPWSEIRTVRWVQYGEKIRKNKNLGINNTYVDNSLKGTPCQEMFAC